MGSYRALIIENRPEWQGTIAKVLESLYWDFDLADSYDQALDRFSETYYDLAVIDPQLNDNDDGLLLIVELHKHFPETHVIIVSNTPSTPDAYPSLPQPNTITMMEKSRWDAETFRSMVLKATITPHDNIGRRTLMRLLLPTKGFQPANQEMPTPPPAQARRGKPHVLIVESNPEWQVTLARTMEDEGWFWRGVPDAVGAMALLQEPDAVFNVALIDPVPESEGRHLLDFLASAELRTRVIIISHTAKPFVNHPVVGFVDKNTFKKNQLLEIIYRVTAKPKLKVQTLGVFQIWCNNEPVDDLGSEDAERLLKILVTQHGGNIKAETLLHHLFPEDSQATLEDKRPALRVLVNTLRHCLEPELSSPEDSAFIAERNGGYFLDMTQPITLDFDEMEQIFIQGKARQTQGEDAEAIAAYEQAVALYQGEYLPHDRTAQWSIRQRNHLQNQIAKIMNRLADLYAKSGDYAQAVRVAQASLHHNAYHESTHRRLMRYHYCNGEHETARAIYHTLEKLMREFFQESPSADTQALYAAISQSAAVPCTEQEER